MATTKQTQKATPPDARMRYRTDKDDGLLLWYELVRPDRVLESAIKDVREAVTDHTALPVYAATGR